MGVELRGQLYRISSFPFGSRDEMWVVRLESSHRKCLYPLSHLASSNVFFQWTISFTADIFHPFVLLDHYVYIKSHQRESEKA